MAYRDGGATAVGLVGLLRMAPSAILAPLSPPADKGRRERVLILVSALRGVITGAAALVGGVVDRRRSCMRSRCCRPLLRRLPAGALRPASLGALASSLLVGVFSQEVAASGLPACVGVGSSLIDLAGFTLLARLATSEVPARCSACWRAWSLCPSACAAILGSSSAVLKTSPLPRRMLSAPRPEEDP
jgi:hypothetical protein